MRDEVTTGVVWINGDAKVNRAPKLDLVGS